MFSGQEFEKATTAAATKMQQEQELQNALNFAVGEVSCDYSVSTCSKWSKYTPLLDSFNARAGHKRFASAASCSHQKLKFRTWCMLGEPF